MDYIEEKKAELEYMEAELDKMPCGDERAEKIGLIDMARREIMTLDVHNLKGRPSHKIEERIRNIFERLMRPDYEDPSLDCPTDFSK